MLLDNLFPVYHCLTTTAQRVNGDRATFVYSEDFISSSKRTPTSRSEAPVRPQVQQQNRAQFFSPHGSQTYGRDRAGKESFVMSSNTNWTSHAGRTWNSEAGPSRARNFSNFAGRLSATPGSPAAASLWKQGDPIIFSGEKLSASATGTVEITESERSESAKELEYLSFSDSEDGAAIMKTTVTETETVTTTTDEVLSEGSSFSVTESWLEAATQSDSEMKVVWDDKRLWDDDRLWEDLPVEKKSFKEAVQSDISEFETMGSEEKAFNALIKASKKRKLAKSPILKPPTFKSPTSKSPTSKSLTPKSPTSKSPEPTEESKAEEKAEESEDAEEFGYTPCTFQIPPKILTRVLSLKEGSVNRFWSHSLYKSEDGKRDIKVHYCTNTNQFEQAASLFFEDAVLGFDMEWAPFSHGQQLKKNVSLIQIANETDIALFHVARVKEYQNTKLPLKGILPEGLNNLLESKTILKTGVNVAGDITRLQKYFDVTPAGIFELSDLHNTLIAEDPEKAVSRKLVALSNLAHKYLSLPLRKGSVRTSDWSKPLNHNQQSYAATDAYAAVRIFDELEKRRRACDPRPKFPPCRDENPKRIQIVKTTKSKVVKEETLSETSASEITVEKKNKVKLKAVTGTTEGVAEEGALELGEKPEKSLKAEMATRAKKERLQKSKQTSNEVEKMGHEMKEAHLWALAYREQQGDACKASVVQIRAYALWHRNGREVGEIAKILRQPPLQEGTVLSYIMDAIRLEKFNYDRARHEELLGPTMAMKGQDSWKFFMDKRRRVS
ncbi:hypothetical protein RUND412_002406 [Rhizina undulata]